MLHDMLPEKDRQIVDVPCDEEVMKEVRHREKSTGMHTFLSCGHEQNAAQK